MTILTIHLQEFSKWNTIRTWLLHNQNINYLIVRNSLNLYIFRQ